MGIAPPKGVPLRPDRDALREAAMTSIARAAIVAALGIRDAGAYRTLAGDRQAELVLRSPSAPLSTTSAAALQTIALAFLSSLVPISASAAILARSIKLSFDGAGSIGIPQMVAPNAGWVTEGGVIPLSQGVSSRAATLSPFKLAVMVALSNELMKNTNAVDLVKAVLIENTAAALDLAMFSAVAETPGVHPGGILAGIASLTPGASMTKDVEQIAQALAPCSGSAGAILVASPGQAAALAMAPRDAMPTYASAALPAGTIVGVVPSAIVSVVEALRLDSSAETTVHLDSSPVDIGVGGTPPVVAARSISTYQTDTTVIRLLMNATWARRSASAVAWVQNVTW